MHIEFRFFANTKLENKEEYKERLLYLFEVCDKICYNVGLGIQELLKNKSEQDQDLINKLQPKFFDKTQRFKIKNAKKTPVKRRAEILSWRGPDLLPPEWACWPLKRAHYPRNGPITPERIYAGFHFLSMLMY